WLPALVDGQRLIRVLHPAAELRIMELHALVDSTQQPFSPAPGKKVRHAQGADRVPNADEFYARFLRMGSSERLRFRGIGASRLAALSIKPVRVIEPARLIAYKDSAFANQSGQAADRVSATAESEQKYLIIRRIALNKEKIRVLDIVRQPDAERAPNE